MVSGCAAERMQLPDFEVAARSDKEVTNPTALPDLCEIPWTSEACWVHLDVFEDIAVNNTDLAQLNADIARDGEEAYDHVLSAGKNQQQVGQIREDMLAEERKDHTFDNMWHRILIIVLAIGMVL